MQHDKLCNPLLQFRVSPNEMLSDADSTVMVSRSEACMDYPHRHLGKDSTSYPGMNTWGRHQSPKKWMAVGYDVLTLSG
jgi:hypothetical protein